MPQFLMVLKVLPVNQNNNRCGKKFARFMGGLPEYTLKQIMGFQLML